MNTITMDDWDVLEEAYFGKSSEQYDYSPAPSYMYSTMTSNAYAPESIPMEYPERAHPAHNDKKRMQAETLRRQKIVSEYKHKEKYITRKRFKEALAVSLGIAVVAGMFSFILYRQSQITSLNFKNNDTQQSIIKLEEETSQIHEKLIANADLSQIRWDAMALGMQEPSARQIVTLEIPRADQLVTNKSNISSPGTKSGIANAKVSLAEYFSDLNEG